MLNVIHRCTVYGAVLLTSTFAVCEPTTTSTMTIPPLEDLVEILRRASRPLSIPSARQVRAQVEAAGYSDDIETVLECPHLVFPAGAPVFVSLHVVNHGIGSKHFDPLTIDTHNHFIVQNENGETVPMFYEEFQQHFPYPHPLPGRQARTVREHLDLTTRYGLTPGHRYTVQFAGHVDRGYHKTKPCFNLPPSNVIAFRIDDAPLPWNMLVDLDPPPRFSLAEQWWEEPGAVAKAEIYPVNPPGNLEIHLDVEKWRVRLGDPVYVRLSLENRMTVQLLLQDRDEDLPFDRAYPYCFTIIRPDQSVFHYCSDYSWPTPDAVEPFRRITLTEQFDINERRIFNLPGDYLVQYTGSAGPPSNTVVVTIHADGLDPEVVEILGSMKPRESIWRWADE